VLCFMLCERAGERLAKQDFTSTSEDLQRALRLKPGYLRARQKMAVLFNNQACDEKNEQRALRLYDQSLEYDPDNFNARQNLAIHLKNMAVELYNNASGYNRRDRYDEAIRLLERAMGLVGQSLKPEALSWVRSTALLGPRVVEQAVAKWEPEILRKVASDLGYMIYSRNHIY